MLMIMSDLYIENTADSGKNKLTYGTVPACINSFSRTWPLIIVRKCFAGIFAVNRLISVIISHSAGKTKSTARTDVRQTFRKLVCFSLRRFYKSACLGAISKC